MFWEPHTSSIDFCESNYLHSSHIVEPHNVWSSFVGIALPGLIGYYQALGAPAPLGEWRVKLSHLILAATGLGSAGLHGTLHWILQSSDELPMIYLVLADLYAIAEVDAPLGRPNHPWLGTATMGVAALITVVYYAFQDLYWVFLATFAAGVVLELAGALRLVYGANARRHGPDVLRIGATGAVSYLVFASTSWVLDMLLCHHGILEFADNQLPGLLRGMTPHVIWHLAAGLGGYCATLFLMSVRCETLGVPFAVHWFLGFVPICSPVLSEKSVSLNKPQQRTKWS